MPPHDPAWWADCRDEHREWTLWWRMKCWQKADWTPWCRLWQAVVWILSISLTSILDKVAPLKTCHWTGPRKAKNWLSPESVDAKKRSRRLKRRWKASNAKPDRLAYRAAYSFANKLILTSFAACNLERINEASKNPKPLWTTIKSILHSSPPNKQLSPPKSQSLANSLASFFRQKFVPLKDSIALKLQGSPTPFDFDLPHSGEVLSDFTPVTPAEVSQLLRPMLNKSSPLDYIPSSLLESCVETFSTLISHLANLFSNQATFHPNSNWHLSHRCWKTSFTKVGSRKFQTHIKSEYHQQNPWASCPFTFFSSRFLNLPVFLFYNLLIVNFI